MEIYKHFDFFSLILYEVMAISGVIFLVKIIKSKDNSKKVLYVILWSLIWTIFATFRYISSSLHIGGTDAPAYITFFNDCLSNHMDPISLHYNSDLLFALFTKFIRLFTSDYHIYFFIIYLFLSLVYIIFVKHFFQKKSNLAPFLLIFYLFLRGFTSIRTNMSVAFILIGIIFLDEKKYKKALIFMICSIFIHKASALYILFYFFYLFYRKRNFSYKKCLLYILISYIICILSQNFLIYILRNFEGAYAYYAGVSLKNNFISSGFWKISFEQIILLVLMIIYRKKLDTYYNKLSVKKKQQYKLLWLLCIFDFITIPITFVFNIWRGYEYLYLARILMWGVLLQQIPLIKIHKKVFKINNILFIVIIMFWIAFRIYNTWDDSSLMPYIFGFFEFK